jgi:uncharacterized membrane protein
MQLSKRFKKVIAWRFLSFFVTILINYLVFGSWNKSFWFTVVLMTIFTILHYYFEMMWEKIEDRI